MEYTHITNLVSMLQALLVGVGMGVYYDCFRFWRRMIQCRWPSVALQDLVFWLTSAVAVFFICIRAASHLVKQNILAEFIHHTVICCYHSE